MPLRNIRDGVFTTGGPLQMWGLQLFGETFCGPALFFTRADNLLRVRMIYYACGYFIKGAEAIGSVSVRQAAADTDMTQCYVKRVF